MLNNKELNPIVTEFFIRGEKLSISFVFITQSYFVAQKNYYTKFHTLFYYENPKETKTSANFI